MNIGDLSEDEILSRITPNLPPSRAVEVPSGDDCAVLNLEAPQVAVSTDMLVEDRHFNRRWFTGEDVGWRAAMQNLADSVAMGAYPISLVISLALPRELPMEWLDGFARGLARACEPWGVGIDGGDLVAGEKIAIGVTVLGDLQGRAPRLRSSARPGEVFAHCGYLGHARLGYELLMLGQPHRGQSYVEKFLCPQPPLEQALHAAHRCGALMDVSDGLLRDADRVARASNVWIDLDSAELNKAALSLEGVLLELGEKDASRRSFEYVLSGGEDHGFIASLPSEIALPEGFRSIGRVLADFAQGRVTIDGEDWRGVSGWDHFSSSDGK